ncbi:right-handed parallel beta-helix repeat-containing protein [uncultured Desulfuromonas sp.]|uniref:right-handed parallel beta-helix repeat-containing protein n=1 Tax=uncultured Desulfuromonas sp. TaxID=181013 RepID=UPI002AAA7FAB|nr:right-handed parallel beta-helix repeat-containing protein [uncultured Desulfuromonas sp.]
MFTAGMSASAVVEVGQLSALRTALQQAGSGTTIRVLPGTYAGGIVAHNLRGTAQNPITITAVDSRLPPVFTGGTEGLKLSNCAYIKVQHLIFDGFSRNGINIDDASKKVASHHVVLDDVAVLNTGSRGNHDAIKLSGVHDFIVRHVRIEAWGGSAIDMVGCRNGLIEACTFSGKQGFRGGNGIQIKGGSHAILVQNNLFQDAGTRTVQIGGLTGKQYFRPSVGDYEAKNVTVSGNTFIGGEAQIAWVTAQDSHVHHNLFYLPEKWLGRILQETKDSQFKPCQRGLFEQNVVITDNRVNTFFNVGQGTEPESFVFRENLWFRLNGDNRPNLPAFETDGIYDVDPMILAGNDGRLQINSADPRLKQIGPDAYKPWTVGSDFSDVSVPRVKVPEVKYSTLDWIEALIK